MKVIRLLLILTVMISIYLIINCSDLTPTVTNPTITIYKPLPVYYEATPDLQYIISKDANGLVIFVNDITVNLSTAMNNIINGFNTVRLVAANEIGGNTEVEVEFFFNKLDDVSTDNFDRADSASIDYGWTEDNSSDNDNLTISSNQLAIGNFTSTADWARITDTSEDINTPEVFQMIDIEAQTKYSEIGLVLKGNNSQIEGALAYSSGSTGDLYYLSLNENLDSTTDYNYMTYEYLNLTQDFYPLKLCFFKFYNSYYVFLLKTSNGYDWIVGKIEVSDFTPLQKEPSNKFGLNFVPKTNTSGSYAIVDNYEINY